MLFELSKAVAISGNKTLYDANREVYGLLRYGVKVRPGLLQGRTAAAAGRDGRLERPEWPRTLRKPPLVSGTASMSVSKSCSVAFSRQNRIYIDLYVLGVEPSACLLFRDQQSAVLSAAFF